MNLGTGSLDRARWGSVADTFLGVMRRVDVGGRTLDVRENVKFRGGYFSQWVHRTFPESACCLAIEFKKFFMDEWTAAPDRSIVDAIGSALQETASSVLTTLGAQRKGEGA